MVHPTSHTWISADGSKKSIKKEPDEKISDQTLRLRFRSQTNLTELSGSDYVTISLCPYNRDYFVSVSGLYADGYPLFYLSNSVGAEISKTWNGGVYVGKDIHDGTSGITLKDGFFYYEAFFEYHGLHHFDEAQHTSIETPLPPTLQDLCFQAAGYGMPWPNYKSNIGIIPHGALSSAINSLKNQR